MVSVFVARTSEDQNKNARFQGLLKNTARRTAVKQTEHHTATAVHRTLSVLAKYMKKTENYHEGTRQGMKLSSAATAAGHGARNATHQLFEAQSLQPYSSSSTGIQEERSFDS